MSLQLKSAALLRSSTSSCLACGSTSRTDSLIRSEKVTTFCPETKPGRFTVPRTFCAISTPRSHASSEGSACSLSVQSSWMLLISGVKGPPCSVKERFVCCAKVRMIKSCSSLGSPIASGRSIHARRSRTFMPSVEPACPAIRVRWSFQCSPMTKWVSPMSPSLSGLAMCRTILRSGLSTEERWSLLRKLVEMTSRTFSTAPLVRRKSSEKFGCAGYWVLSACCSISSSAGAS